MHAGLFQNSSEKEEFPEESSQGWNARQRHHGQTEHACQSRSSLVQLSQLNDVFGAGVLHDQNDDHEGCDHGKEIASQVVENGAGAIQAHCSDPHHQIPGMCDARIAQQSFEVALGQGAEIAIKDGDGCHAHEQRFPAQGHIRNRDPQQPHE